jgi:GNAT superfamily N-acetyltransferase
LPPELSRLFAAGRASAVEMTAADIAELQRFFEANPHYHLAVDGEPPPPAAAQEEFDALPPADWPFEKKWLLRFNGEDGAMVAMADLISNLFTKGVWHIGLFIVATRLHGNGTAHKLYGSLESWMRAQGCRWSRLGVVEGNARAERFWEKLGYVELRKRMGIEMGLKTNNVRVMVKPLANGALRQYLAAVPRDLPE